MTLVAALFAGLYIGGFLAFWFEDVLRGPVMRAYDDALYGNETSVPYWIDPVTREVIWLEE